jgi:hypothetical protein
MTFDAQNPDTWPLWLYPEHMVAIYPHYKTVVAFELAVRRRRFDLIPAKRRPMRWRRADVRFDVEGPVASALRVRKAS